MTERPADQPNTADVVFEQTELTGLNLFDDRASLAGSFPRTVWGYDRTTVDTHVRDLEQQLTALKRLTRELRSQLREALSSTREGDFRRLGTHAGAILISAENQARALVTRAESEAERIKEEGRRSVADLRRSAQTEIDDIRMAGLAHLRELRTEHDRTVSGILEAARHDADATLDAARRHADALRFEAEQKATTMLRDAELAAESLRQRVAREAAQQELEARTRIEALLTEAKAAADEARTTSSTLMAESTAHHERSAAALRDQTEQAQQVRSTALAEAEQTRSAAAREAEAAIQAAHQRGDELRQTLEDQHAWRREQIEREIAALLQRKAAVVAQLANMRNLAREATEDFPDEDPFETTDLPTDAGAVDPVDLAPPSRTSPPPVDDDPTRVLPILDAEEPAPDA
ncbi:MAG: DivIVA domain-containing protein [Propionibacterium sp.]|nr:DivIVA domain-containing protein [Propionibacterium sp.]